MDVFSVIFHALYAIGQVFLFLMAVIFISGSIATILNDGTHYRIHTGTQWIAIITIVTIILLIIITFFKIPFFS